MYNNVNISMEEKLKIMKDRLNSVKSARELAIEANLINNAAINIDLSLPEIGEEGCVFKVNIGTTGGLRKAYMSGNKLENFIYWAIRMDDRNSYCIIHCADKEFVEIIKHDSITGVRFESDEDMKAKSKECV